MSDDVEEECGQKSEERDQGGGQSLSHCPGVTLNIIITWTLSGTYYKLLTQSKATFLMPISSTISMCWLDVQLSLKIMIYNRIYLKRPGLCFLLGFSDIFLSTMSGETKKPEDQSVASVNMMRTMFPVILVDHQCWLYVNMSIKSRPRSSVIIVLLQTVKTIIIIINKTFDFWQSRLWQRVQSSNILDTRLYLILLKVIDPS